MGEASLGLGLVVLAGLCSGSFALPFNKNTNWSWENNWLIWSFVALVIAPWLVAFQTVPNLMEIYQLESDNLLLIAIFGITWGVGAMLFGKGIDLLGISLSMPIMLGLINSVGTVMPIALRDPNELLEPSGLKILLGVAIILLGIVVVSIAGTKKEANKKTTTNAAPKSSFWTGMIVCILAGVFGPMINFAFVYGEPIQTKAIEFGTEAVHAANPVWAIVLTGGFLINTLYCIYLLKTNKTAKKFKGAKPSNWIFAALAGVIWYLSIMFYGMGSNSLGEQGASVGWATMQTLSILTGNIAGIVIGEWKNASKSTFIILACGIALLVVGLLVIAF